MRQLYITGVSRGLGLELSKALAHENTQTIGFSRSRGDYVGEFHPVDLTQPRLAAGIFAQAFEGSSLPAASSLIFISNAGQLGPLNFIERLDPVEIQENLTANLTGAAVALSQFIRYTHRLDIPKLFVQISSAAALPNRAKPGWSLYSAAKAGQDQLIQVVANEQKHATHPAKIITIIPGVMETAMQKLIRETPKEAFPDVERFIKLKEAGKSIDPAIVARRIAVLLDDLPSIENGKTYQLGEIAPPNPA